MSDRRIGYLAVAGARAPVATPVFFAPFAGSYWIVSRRNTIKVESGRAGGKVSLLVPVGRGWRLVRGEATVVDPLRLPASWRSIRDGMLAPVATAAFARRNGRALLSIWMKHPELLAAVSVAGKVLFVVHPESETSIASGRGDAIYAARSGDSAVVLPVRREGDTRLVLSESAAAVASDADEQCAISSIAEWNGEISVSGRVALGIGKRNGRTITFTGRRRSGWDGVRAGA